MRTAKKDIILYTDTICPICALVEKYLSERGVQYSKVNVDEDPEGKIAFLELGYDHLPVLNIEGTPILGFNTEAIETALKENNRKSQAKLLSEQTRCYGTRYVSMKTFIVNSDVPQEKMDALDWLTAVPRMLRDERIDNIKLETA